LEKFEAGLDFDLVEDKYRSWSGGLYLSRNHVRPGVRGVINEDEVIKYLTSRNFTILNGAESLEETYYLFSRATKIIGPHGSLFANTMFCKEDCHILEYCPSNRIDGTFLNKLKKAKKYKQIIVESDESFNIFIDIETMTSILS
jgi:capsular polysaccharide biosynthesis protein